MKRTLIPLALLAFTTLALAQSGGTLKSVNSTNELVMLNPRSGNTNVLVHSMPWLSSSFWTWHEGDTTGPDTNHLDSVLYPGLGRWVWNNIGTNYFQTLVVSNLVGAGNSIWTNEVGVYRPLQLQSALSATNIASHFTLTANGAFIIPCVVGLDITNGLNCINPYTNSYLWLGSDVDATDPTARTVTLTSGNGQGTFLFLHHRLFGLTSSTFQITNGTPQCDDPTSYITLINGDWKPTQEGETLFLLNNGNGWSEVARFYASAGTSQTNIFDLYGTNIFNTNQFSVQLSGTNALVSVRNQPYITNLVNFQLITLSGLPYTFPWAFGPMGKVLTDMDGAGNLVWSGSITNPLHDLVISNIVQVGTNYIGTNTLINPTDNYYPVRDNATNFADGAWYRVGGTNAAIDSQIIFGPGTTNVLFRETDNLTYTNGAGDVQFNVVNGSGGIASLEMQNNAVFLRASAPAVSAGLRNPTTTVQLFGSSFYPTVNLGASLGGQNNVWNTTVTSNLWIEGFEKENTNYSRTVVYQPGTNSPVIFDQQTAEQAGYSRGFSFRTNGVEVFNVTGSGGASSAANWVAQTNVSSMLAGTAFFGASARTNWLDQVNITSPMVSAWVTDNGDPSRMQPYWQVSKDGVWNKLAATFYIDLATNYLHFGGTADNGATNGPWFSFNARNDIPFTQLDLGQSWNNSFFHLDPFATAGPNFWFTVATNNTSDTILAITNMTTRVLGLKTNGDLTLAGKVSAEGNYVLENDGNGASVVGMIPVYTDTTGRKVTPTNTLSSLSIANLTGTNWGADLVPYFDANTNLQTSATTTAELGFLHGVTSDIQGQLNGKKDDFDLVRSVGFSVDGGGSAISPGKVKGFFTVPFSGTIQAWNITVDTGTATVKVWKIATGTAKPTAANSINTSGIAIAANTHIHSTTLTDFTTTTVTAGDIIAFNIEAVASATELSGSIEILQN